MARTIKVDVFYVYGGEIVWLAKNLSLDATEIFEFSNRRLNQAFQEQYPRIFNRIPIWCNRFNHSISRAGFEVQNRTW